MDIDSSPIDLFKSREYLPEDMLEIHRLGHTHTYTIYIHRHHKEFI